VAPNQYEFAPLFGSVITQTDQNLMVMQICEEVAAKHDLACLLQAGGLLRATNRPKLSVLLLMEQALDRR
jgi:hypothetical protein